MPDVLLMTDVPAVGAAAGAAGATAVPHRAVVCNVSNGEGRDHRATVSSTDSIRMASAFGASQRTTIPTMRPQASSSGPPELPSRTNCVWKVTRTLLKLAHLSA